MNRLVLKFRCALAYIDFEIEIGIHCAVPLSIVLVRTKKALLGFCRHYTL